MTTPARTEVTDGLDEAVEMACCGSGIVKASCNVSCSLENSNSRCDRIIRGLSMPRPPTRLKKAAVSGLVSLMLIGCCPAEAAMRWCPAPSIVSARRRRALGECCGVTSGVEGAMRNISDDLFRATPNKPAKLLRLGRRLEAAASGLTRGDRFRVSDFDDLDDA